VVVTRFECCWVRERYLEGTEEARRTFVTTERLCAAGVDKTKIPRRDLKVKKDFRYEAWNGSLLLPSKTAFPRRSRCPLFFGSPAVRVLIAPDPSLCVPPSRMVCHYRKEVPASLAQLTCQGCTGAASSPYCDKDRNGVIQSG
jgi:hypothetical protein